METKKNKPMACNKRVAVLEKTLESCYKYMIKFIIDNDLAGVMKKELGVKVDENISEKDLIKCCDLLEKALKKDDKRRKKKVIKKRVQLKRGK